MGNSRAKDDAVRRKSLLSSAAGAQNVEQWAVNKAVHNSEWANFGRKDFEPVVAAFKELLECFCCGMCNSWVYVTPEVEGVPGRCSAAWVVKGTRLTVEAILDNAEDCTAEEIATEIFQGVTVEQARRILAFAGMR